MGVRLCLLVVVVVVVTILSVPALMSSSSVLMDCIFLPDLVVCVIFKFHNPSSLFLTGTIIPQHNSGWTQQVDLFLHFRLA